MKIPTIKYQVGDIVKIKRTSRFYGQSYLNGEIKLISPDHGHPHYKYYVVFPDYDAYYNDRDLKLVEGVRDYRFI